MSLNFSGQKLPFLWLYNSYSEMWPGYPQWSSLPAAGWQTPEQPIADPGVASCFIQPNFFCLSVCLLKLSCLRFDVFRLSPMAFPAFKEFLLFRAGWVGSVSDWGWQRVCKQGAPSLPFGKQARKMPRKGDCTQHPKVGTGEVLQSPTRMSFSKVVCDPGNLLTTGQQVSERALSATAKQLS